MNKFLLFAIGLVVLASIVASDCKLKKKKFLKMVKKYNKCLDKGFSSKLGCSSSDKIPSKKVVRKCTKIEKKLENCGYECEQEYTLRATCDNAMTVYVDGAVQEADGTGLWPKESVIPVSSSLTVIAIKCVDTGGPEGLLASLHNAAGEDVLVTDGSWSCSDEEEEDWMKPNFKETSGNWGPADVIGQHGMSPWGKIGQISDNAKWIWTKTRSSGADEIVCRYTTSEYN